MSVAIESMKGKRDKLQEAKNVGLDESFPGPIRATPSSSTNRGNKEKLKKTNGGKTQSERELEHLYTVNKYSDFFFQFQLL